MTSPFGFPPVSREGSDYLDKIRTVRPLLVDLAREYDRSGAVASESFSTLRDAGILGAAVPAEFGGLDVRSPHDLAAGAFELAQGCSSTAIAAWMHIGATFGFASAWRALIARGRTDAATGLGGTLHAIALGKELLCVAGTEPGVYPGQAMNTVAERSDAGWIINGMKTFATLSPLATTLLVSAKANIEGQAYVATARISRVLPGVDIANDWDGMGMRGSGSGVVRFTNVLVAPEAMSIRRPLGAEDPEQHYNWLSANAGLISSALGIAQVARDRTIELARTRVKAPVSHPAAERVAVQLAVADMEIKLSAAKAMQRAHLLDVERLYAEFTVKTAPLALLRAFLAAAYATKRYVECSSIDVVNQAMDLAGGGSYVANSDFSRWYRDVRALPFMAPTATEMTQVIGKVALGLQPTIDY